MKKIIFMTLATILAWSLSGQAQGKPTEKVIGATVGDFGDLVREHLKPALEKKNYKIKVVEFTDYVQPNIALADGALDLNIFQHKPYLDQFAKEKGLALQEVAQVPTAPLGIYAGKVASLAGVKSGSTVAVPNDPTNLARALVILRDLGWVELPEKLDAFKVTPQDIKKNLKNIKIIQLEAAQLPRARQDVDFAIINGNYVVSAGLSLTSALAVEKSDSYVNWAVARKNDVNSAFVKDVKEVLASPEFQAYAKKRFPGYKYPSSWK